LADDAIAEDFTDGVPRRDLRLHAGRHRNELQSVDHLLARVLVVDVPGEVTLHVGQSEQRLRANVIEMRHAREADLERDGDVALYLFGAPTFGLRDELDERRDRIGIRLDVELLIAVEAEAEHSERQHADDGGHLERKTDEFLDHNIPDSRMAPEVTML